MARVETTRWVPFLCSLYIYIYFFFNLEAYFFFFLAICRLSLVVASEDHSLVAFCGLLFAGASPVAGHRL